MVRLILVLCLLGATSAAHAASTVFFHGATGSRSVSGSFSYNPGSEPDFVYDSDDGQAAQYFPGFTFSFTSNGYSVTEGYRLAVFDAFAGNAAGTNDSFGAFVVRGGSGREQFGFNADYDTASALSGTGLLASFPNGPATFSYNFAGDGYSIPVTFSTTVMSGAVPEASTWAYLMCGLAMMGGLMRHRRASDHYSIRRSRISLV